MNLPQTVGVSQRYPTELPIMRQKKKKSRGVYFSFPPPPKKYKALVVWGKNLIIY